MIMSSKNNKTPRKPKEGDRSSFFSHLDLDKVVKIVLIASIIIVSIGIVSFLNRPKEQYAIFMVLNEDKRLGDYPTNASVQENVSLHTYVESHYSEETEFMVRVYKGNNDTTITSENGTTNAQWFRNITVEPLSENENWTSQIINVSFDIMGENQTILFELWKKNLQGEWHYVPNQVLFVRIDVIANAE